MIIISETGIYIKSATFGYIPLAIGIFSIKIIIGAGYFVRSLKIVFVSLVVLQLSGSYIISSLTDNRLGIWVSMTASLLFFAIYGYLQVKQRTWLRIKV